MRFVAFLALAGLVGCTEFVPDFAVRPGVRVSTVLDAQPNASLTLYDDAGDPLVGVTADEAGQAHFAYVPDAFATIDAATQGTVAFEDGSELAPGTYWVEDDLTGETAGFFDVLEVDDLPDPSLYDGQVLDGIHSSPLTGDDGDPEDGFSYVQMRDGTLLSVMVRFPDPLLYGEGPYPTLIEYSGYSPSRPSGGDAGSEIANALGYATVGVNMRGSGCSGGVFDLFNPAQHADGYDIVEIVARQEWVLNHQVGMVGLSYSGISQLFVGSTAPPSLAAIVPQSTIADPWAMQWPGGIYNSGFTRQWVEERESQAEAGGASWVVERIDNGDEVCADNVGLSHLGIQFEPFLRALQYRPRDADLRDLNELVRKIEVPVFQTGSFQDEQTGAQFGAMLDHFDRSPNAKFLLTNGRHPDGYAPRSVSRWFEFMEFYVAERIPEVNSLLRSLGSEEFGRAFGIEGLQFEADRFTDQPSYDAALAAYESEAPVRVLFESGAGSDDWGTPVERFEVTFDQWPPTEAEPLTWHLDGNGRLADDAPSGDGADTWQFDPEAGGLNFFGPAGYQLLVPLWDVNWTRFAEGDVASYVTGPFLADRVVSGPGIADLWIRSPEEEVQVQVTLSEVTPEGNEVYIQSGWLRLGHRAGTVGPDMRIERSYAKDDFEPVPVGEWTQAMVQIPSFAHPVRAGSSLRLSVSTPGRDHGTWAFEAPEYDGEPVFELGWGGEHASTLMLAHIPDIDVPEGLPPCPSLRGQPCRGYEPVANVPSGAR